MLAAAIRGPSASRRSMQRRAMAGLDPTAEQQAEYDAGAPERDARGEMLGTIGGELTGVQQAIRAGGAIKEAATAPSLANFTNAGVQTGLAAFRPLLAAKIAAGGYATAAAGDAATNFISPAQAADPKAVEAKIRAMPPDQLKALQRRLGIPEDGKPGPNTIGAAVADEENQERLSKIAIETEAAKARAVAEAEGQTKLRGAAADADRGKISDAKAKLMADLMRGREPAKDTSMTGALYDKLGIMTPFLGAVGAGALARAGTEKLGFSKMLSPKAPVWQKMLAKGGDDYVLPAAAGMEVGSTLQLAPLAAQANRPDQTNPAYRAWENYRLALPASATEEIGYADAQLNPAVNPKIDPSVTAAQERLNDPSAIWSARAVGALGGMFGNVAAAGVPAIGRGAVNTAGAAGTAVMDGAGALVSKVAELPGKAAAGYQRGMAGAAEERGKRALTSRSADEAELLAQQSRAAAQQSRAAAQQSQVDAAETARRSGGQAGGAGQTPAGQKPPAQSPAGQSPETLPVTGSSSPPNLVDERFAQIQTALQAGAITQREASRAVKELADMIRDFSKTDGAKKLLGNKDKTSGGEGVWMQKWSGPARQYVDEILSSGGAVTRNNGGTVTGPRLTREIGARSVDGSAPKNSEATRRAGMLFDDLEKKRKKGGTDLENFRKLIADPKYKNFMLPGALAGAGGAAAMSEYHREELARAMRGY